jgi:hypothetical protein
MSKWHPKPEDLTPYMHQVMESAYEERERPRCSRDDFFDGYLAALRVLRSKSSFQPDHWRDDPAE